MALREGVRPWRRRDKQADVKSLGLTKRKVVRRQLGVDVKLRKVEQFEPVKAAMEVRKIAPISIPMGLFDPRGRSNVSIEDLREDVISIYKNSRKSYADIRAAGGPCAGTMSRLLGRQTMRPQLNTLRAILLACDYDIVFVRKAKAA